RQRLQGARGFTSSPWAQGGKVYCLDQSGTTFVVQAGKEFKLLGRNKLDELFWSSPAAARGAPFLRGGDHLYCVRWEAACCPLPSACTLRDPLIVLVGREGGPRYEWPGDGRRQARRSCAGSRRGCKAVSDRTALEQMHSRSSSSSPSNHRPSTGAGDRARTR